MVDKVKTDGRAARGVAATILISLMFFAVVGYAYLFMQKAVEDITSSTIRTSTESAHGDLVLVSAQALKSEITTLIDAYAATSDDIDWPVFSRSAPYVAFDGKVRELVTNSRVVKLKLYADDSVTIYSSEPSQIGEEKSEIEQVTHALRGRSSSQVSPRASFISFSGELQNVEIVSSYHPLMDDAGAVIAVVEIYSDRTSDFKKIRDYGQMRVGQFLIVLALALAIWCGHILFGALRHRETD